MKKFFFGNVFRYVLEKNLHKANKIKKTPQYFKSNLGCHQI